MPKKQEDPRKLFEEMGVHLCRHRNVLGMYIFIHVHT